MDFTVAPSTISERNGTATITVPITNGVVFATDQVIALSFAGTAIPSDFTVEDASNFALTSPYQLILAAGATSVTGTIKPVDDDVYEGDETIEVAASLSGTAIGSAQTVTVTDEADRAKRHLDGTAWIPGDWTMTIFGHSWCWLSSTGT